MELGNAKSRIEKRASLAFLAPDSLQIAFAIVSNWKSKPCVLGDRGCLLVLGEEKPSRVHSLRRSVEISSLGTKAGEVMRGHPKLGQNDV